MNANLFAPFLFRPKSFPKPACILRRRKAADGTLLDKKGFPIAEDNTELVGYFSLGKDSTMKELGPIIQISMKRGENILIDDLKLKIMQETMD